MCILYDTLVVFIYIIFNSYFSRIFLYIANYKNGFLYIYALNININSLKYFPFRNN